MDAKSDRQIDPRSAMDGTPAPKRRLSPINQRRWRNFRANKRGFWSL